MFKKQIALFLLMSLFFAVSCANPFGVDGSMGQPSEKSDKKDITDFIIRGTNDEFPDADISKSGTIVGTEITIIVPFGTNIRSMTPTITCTGKNIAPASGIAQDFTNPIEYVVTAEDGTIKKYIVHVVVTQNTAKDIIAFTIRGTASI